MDPQTQPSDNFKGPSAEKGLPVEIQRQLAKDIELAGGIHTFEDSAYSLDDLLKGKETIYGERGSRRRKQIRNVVFRWRKYNKEKFYRTVFIPLVLQQNTKWSEPNGIPDTPDTTSSIQDNKFGGNSNTEPDPQPAQPSRSPKPILTKPATTKLASSIFETPKPQIMNDNNTFTIKVNTERPEANREAGIYELDRIAGAGDKKNQLYSGFWIVLPIDIRFILDDMSAAHWSARIIAKNKILLSTQAWNYSCLYDRDEFKKNVQPNELEALDGAHHDIYDESSGEIKEDRKWKHLVLEFPERVKLSAKEIYGDSGEDDKLELQLLPVTVTHPKQPKLKYTSMFAAWKVARVDIRARKKGKVGKKDKKSDAARQLEDLMNGISISIDSKPAAKSDSDDEESEVEESEVEESEDEESEEEERMKICDIETLRAQACSNPTVKPGPVFSLETVPKLPPVPQGIPSVLFAAAPTLSLAPNPPTRDTQEMTEELRKNSFKPQPSSKVSRALTAEQRRKERRAEKQNQARLKSPTPGIDANFLQGLIVAADTSHEKTKEIMAKSTTSPEASIGAGSEADTDKEDSDDEDSVDAYRHARRMEKAHELLKEEKGGDIAWCDAMIADLEKFVSENEAGLDDLLAEDDLNALLGAEDSGSDGESCGTGTGTIKRKRSWGEASSDEETDTDTEMDGEELLEPPTKRK
ncbi:unknown protein [Seminavis robusta]|uniref:Uncharacterized protein n=1 Tax=Seminavis robusta TaxID=568900 RepID=A0A9N8HA37_9STRA|nr:unknown protein [Seminavis robusta]|eukprot:Sro278_g106570.1 n/a (695) ;mRNA; f:40989-43163